MEPDGRVGQHGRLGQHSGVGKFRRWIDRGLGQFGGRLGHQRKRRLGRPQSMGDHSRVGKLLGVVRERPRRTNDGCVGQSRAITKSYVRALFDVPL